jgi:hypothetical protein
VVCCLWQPWELVLRANLQFPCQLKQAAPLKAFLWMTSWGILSDVFEAATQINADVQRAAHTGSPGMAALATSSCRSE